MFRSIPLLAIAVPMVLVVAGCAEGIASRPNPAEAARICAGIPEAQSRAVFSDLRADVDRVDAVREWTKTKPFVERPVGADIYIRATPGMTAQWMNRLMRCHLVREQWGAACVKSDCPFALEGVTIDVSPTDAGFVIAIRSSDFDVAREIVRRSRVVFEPASSANENRHASLSAE